jgi:NitT/TauT family transport system substrate-binding protein
LPVFAIGQLGQSAMFVFLLRADLKDQVRTIAQLKGRRVGTPVGTSTQRPMGQMVAEHLLGHAGLKPGDVQFVSTGLNRKSQSAALSSGTVDAIMGDEPFASEMVAKGEAVILADMYPTVQSRELLGGAIVRAALATRENIYERHPETVKKILRMFDRTLQWMSAHSARETADILSDQPGFTPRQRKMLTDILQRSHGMYPSRIAWDAHAVATTEQFFRINSTDPASAQLSFADFIRNTPGTVPD